MEIQALGGHLRLSQLLAQLDAQLDSSVLDLQDTSSGGNSKGEFSQSGTNSVHSSGNPCR